MEQGQLCGLCGTAPWEWVENPSAYVPVIHQCVGCMKKDLLKGGEELSKQPGASIRLVPPDTAAKMVTTKAKRPESARERARRTRDDS